MTCSDTLSPGMTAPARPLRQEEGYLRRIFASAVQMVKLWQRRRHDRETLRKLPDYLLRDVGLDVAEARFEGDKPFWRA